VPPAHQLGGVRRATAILEAVEMIERWIRDIAQLLKEHGVIPEVVGSQVADAEELPLLGNVLRTLAPDRVLFEDAECIYQDEDLVALLAATVHTTGGDWTPQEIHARLDREENLATIEFDANGDPHRMEFEQYGDYINDGFFESLNQYAAVNLPGRFFKYSSLWQQFYLVYLPEPAATDLHQLLQEFAPSSDELAEFVTSADKWTEKGYTGWYLAREVLRDMNLRHINEPTKSGDYVISRLRTLANHGSDWAIELEGEIIGLGADPNPDE